MAKDTLTHEQREIVRAQNDALLRLPADRDDRLALIHGYRREKALENDKIAQAKKDVGSSETLKRLTGTYGLKPQAIKTINLLAEMAPTDRSAALRQIMNHGQDEGWVIPDLFDHDAIGVGSNDAAGETAGFDATSEGKRRGGRRAEPRTTEQMASSHQPAPTPGVDLSTPEARAAVEKELQAYLEANPPKRGPVPKERKRLEALVAEARAIESGDKPAADAGPAPAATEELPEAKPGEISAALRESNQAGDEHIRKVATEGPSAPPAPSAEAEVAPEKPKRARKAKAESAPAAAAPPPPPPAEEDDEDDRIPPGPPVHRPDALGTAPASFRMG